MQANERKLNRKRTPPKITPVRENQGAQLRPPSQRWRRPAGGSGRNCSELRIRREADLLDQRGPQRSNSACCERAISSGVELVTISAHHAHAVLERIALECRRGGVHRALRTSAGVWRFGLEAKPLFGDQVAKALLCKRRHIGQIGLRC